MIKFFFEDKSGNLCEKVYFDQETRQNEFIDSCIENGFKYLIKNVDENFYESIQDLHGLFDYLHCMQIDNNDLIFNIEKCRREKLSYLKLARKEKMDFLDTQWFIASELADSELLEKTKAQKNILRNLEKSKVFVNATNFESIRNLTVESFLAEVEE